MYQEKEDNKSLRKRIFCLKQPIIKSKGKNKWPDSPNFSFPVPFILPLEWVPFKSVWGRGVTT